MVENSPVKMSRHAAGDWCHLCGQREYETADIWYDKNSEEAVRKGIAERTEYIRICRRCAMMVMSLTSPAE